MYKFGSLKQAEWQMMYDLAKMFLYCFNHWKLETPSVHTKSTPTDDQRFYKENYIRFIFLRILLYLLKKVVLSYTTCSCAVVSTLCK